MLVLVADELKISLSTLYRKLKRYNLKVYPLYLRLQMLFAIFFRLRRGYFAYLEISFPNLGTEKQFGSVGYHHVRRGNGNLSTSSIVGMLN
ncbi:helix-turn-helix domain-containing protein [Peribacillus simplex]|uniref:helix-turn-helix domain-containing protein n=1 Tax=Peribacillus TaxID=2675229 RepID=UPI0036DEC098